MTTSPLWRSWRPVTGALVRLSPRDKAGDGAQSASPRGFKHRFRSSLTPQIGESETLEAAIEWQGRQRGFRLSVSYKDEKERRQKLRALYWYLKSKIEAVTFGLVDLEQEFLPYLIVAGGQTVYEHLGGSDIKLLPPEGGGRLT